MALRVEFTSDSDTFVVSGRGELHLTILLENMRREGYELAVGRPRVVMKEVDGVKQEPYELLTVDVEDGHQGRGDGRAGAAAVATCRTCRPMARAAPVWNTAFRRVA